MNHQGFPYRSKLVAFTLNGENCLFFAVLAHLLVQAKKSVEFIVDLSFGTVLVAFSWLRTEFSFWYRQICFGFRCLICAKRSLLLSDFFSESFSLAQLVFRIIHV